jgi:ABC-2 type transport system permease protein
MPPSAYFTAKIFMSLVFSALIVAGLSALAVVFCDVRLPGVSWLALTASLLLGALPFCALGLALSYVCGPNSAPAVVNLIYLPMAFASGLWIPIHVLPEWIQTAAPALPAYHLDQLALAATGLTTQESPGIAILGLLGFTVLGLAGAHLGYRRSEGKTWG